MNLLMFLGIICVVLIVARIKITYWHALMMCESII